MRFEFSTANRILFGPGTIQEVGQVARQMGRHAFVLANASLSAQTEVLLEQLRNYSLEWTAYDVSGEPATSLVLDAVVMAKKTRCDLVIAVGGGSVLDTGKAVSALLTNHGDLMDYLEVVGKGEPLRQPSAPCIAIPTTAGTGAEVTRNAVLTVPESHVKISMRSPHLLPRLALVDPELTWTMPPALTASTGLDALTQLLEAFVCNQTNPLTDSLCREGLNRAARSLKKAFENGDDHNAREDMSLASLFSGLALANAKLGAVHGLAATIGGKFPAPHGMVCACLLPHIMETNIRALQERSKDSPALERYQEFAKIALGKSRVTTAKGLEWVVDLCQSLDVQPLSAFGVTEQDIPAITEQAMKASSMKGNPIVLTEEELQKTLVKALAARR